MKAGDGSGKSGKDGRKKGARPQGREALASDLARRMAASLLPGDTPMPKGQLAEAAQFLLAAALERETGKPAIMLQTAAQEKRFMRIAIVNDDMPFLVDSVAAAIAAEGLAIDRIVHPVIPVERNGKGQLTGFGSKDEKSQTRESFIYIETARIDARQRRVLETALAITLGDVRATVEDWPKMQQAMAEDANALGDSEGAVLLRWLNGGMLTQLGHLVRRRDGRQNDLAGICRKSTRSILSDASFERAFAWFEGPAPDTWRRAPLVIKGNRIAYVHRRVPLDLFIVPVIEDGQVVALSVHAGIWTSAALAAAPDDVPRLRSQLATLMGRLGFDAQGHGGKTLVHALTALPHDLVIGFSDSDLERIATVMMSLADRPRPRLALVAAPLARHVFAFAWLPRDLISTQTRLRITALLTDAANASVLDWSLQVEGSLATLRFVLDIRDGGPLPDEAGLDSELQAMLRGWCEAVEAELAHDEDRARAAALANRYAEAFPQGYRATYGAKEAAIDIRRIRYLGALGSGMERRRDARLYSLGNDRPGELRLKIYQYEGALPLSDAVPALENFGFRVLGEIPTSLEDGAIGTIHDFTLALPHGGSADPVLERASVVEDAISAVLNSQAENDAFNYLVIAAGLNAVETEWLRAICRYLRQGAMSYSIASIVEALARAPDATRSLVELFRTGHDPDFAGNREKALARIERTFRDALLDVSAINDDRILRLYCRTIGAIVRTNAFSEAGREALAFKIDSAQVPKLPSPLPWREIWVYSRRVEGVHLRAGPVARGGIRWSSRRDDFRTEILGLMKAQRVKNAVIVPTGAKGGFYPKQLPDPAHDRPGWAAEGEASYRIFIRSLLSITDNIVDGAVVHPADVVIRDGEDPYLVVAADKGTARFSDVANAIAANRDFWLDDAFASGGSKGYDHKAMGITARGAWISVQRHFSEMGVDVQRDTIRVMGCGDMSGDVFGNGMLLSKAIKLVAAFDHRHIFIDPDPDPARSWKERKRLFELERSSWEDYDSSLISAGGGVFARTTKRIALSKQARKALGIDAKELDPDALISAILRAPLDLLWFGGIGTYVKSARETDGQVGDPANDALRVDAGELRVKAIGEGANLGCTQAGRIDFALAGGRINTDFIDNSAGVDCSDHEVNIKIAFAAAKRAGRLSEKRRIAILEAMTGDVARLVLEDNRLQALALSIAEQGGARTTALHLRLIEALEDHGALDRRGEGLADSEALARRASEGQGLTRPELAVLLSSAKLVIQGAIEDSDIPDDPGLEPLLFAAFPEPMQRPFAAQLRSHRLRRELIATKLANGLVNRFGLIHPFELADEESVTLAQVAAAFAAVTQLFQVEVTWRQIEESAMPEHARLALFDRLALALRSHMADLLRISGGTVSQEAAAQLQSGIASLSDRPDELLSEDALSRLAEMQAQLITAEAPDSAIAPITHLFSLDGAVGLARLAEDSGKPVRTLAAAFTSIGSRLSLDWLQGAATSMNPTDPWERLLISGLARDVQQMRLDFLRRFAIGKGSSDKPFAAFEIWASQHDGAILQFEALVARAKRTSPITPAILAQIASQARNLLQH